MGLHDPPSGIAVMQVRLEGTGPLLRRGKVRKAMMGAAAGAGASCGVA